MDTIKIFTSYHARLFELKAAGFVCVSISRFQPKYIKDVRVYDKIEFTLAPTGKMLKMQWPDEYMLHFNRQLADLKPQRVYDELAALAREKGTDKVVLLCYEKDRCDCHRNRVAEWLENALGIAVTEVPPKGQLGKPAPQDPPAIQTTLFG